MLRGNHPARVDEKGRLKIPNGFLRHVLSRFGADVFVTSISGENVLVFPMETWVEMERKLHAVPSSLPAKQRLLDRYHFYGQESTIDKQGRLLIHPHLRESAEATGPVDVLGKYDYLEIWNHTRLLEKFKSEPYTSEHSAELVRFGV